MRVRVRVRVRVWVRVRVRVRAWVSYLAVDDVVLVHDAHALLEVAAVLDGAAQRHEGDLVVPGLGYKVISWYLRA